jgi:hypothetical protein
MKNIVGMCLCLAGVVLLATSDAFVNMSASSVLGSTQDSQFSFKAVAVGITIALLATGSIAHLLNNKLAIGGVWIITILACGFSAVLTIQSTAIDYQANDQSKRIQKNVQNNNDDSIADLKEEKREIQKKIDECKKDQYFAPCAGSYRRLEAISNQITDLRRENTASVRAQEIDITDAVSAKAGIDGHIIERVGIYLRAIGVPLLISLLMFGFWEFFSRHCENVK